MRSGIAAHDSGLQWLAKMPPDWEMRKFSRATFIAEGQVDPEDEDYSQMLLVCPNHIESGTGRLISRETAAAQGAISGKYLCETGDVIYSKIRPALQKATLASERCLCSADMYPLRAQSGVDPRFLLLLVLSTPFTSWAILESDRVAMPKINREALSALRVPVPPISQQQAIVNYIACKTGELDSLVTAKDRVLTLLAEKRRALITRAITRGLDPNVPLRESGAEWLGLIPAHWETERSRWLFRERDERSTTGEEELLTVSHLTGVTPRSEKDVNMFEADTTEGYKICLAGDLAINTLWAWMGAMGVSRVDGIVSPAYNVYKLGDKLNPDYVDALVRLPLFTQEIIRYSKGVWSSRLRLYPEGFFEAVFPVPSVAEQRAIVRHISTETARIDAISAATERTIQLLQERRAGLISAAVTGKIEIPEAAA